MNDKKSAKDLKKFNKLRGMKLAPKNNIDEIRKKIMKYLIAVFFFILIFK